MSSFTGFQYINSIRIYCLCKIISFVDVEWFFFFPVTFSIHFLQLLCIICNLSSWFWQHSWKIHCPFLHRHMCIPFQVLNIFPCRRQLTSKAGRDNKWNSGSVTCSTKTLLIWSGIILCYVTPVNVWSQRAAALFGPTQVILHNKLKSLLSEKIAKAKKTLWTEWQHFCHRLVVQKEEIEPDACLTD